MKWLSLYSDVVSDPKVQLLPGDKFKAWINLLCVASQHDGILPPLADLAFTLRTTEDKITALLDDLVEKGLLDVTSDDRYTPAILILAFRLIFGVIVLVTGMA